MPDLTRKGVKRAFQNTTGARRAKLTDMAAISKCVNTHYDQKVHNLLRQKVPQVSTERESDESKGTFCTENS